MITKVFLDTNVLLDCIVKGRSHAAASMKVLDLVRGHNIEAVVTTQSVIDMAYVDRNSPNHEAFNNFISWMIGHINVEQLDSFDIKEAIIADGADFEDEAQVAHAISSACHYFITSDKGLLKKDIPGMEIISPESFIDRLICKEK